MTRNATPRLRNSQPPLSAIFVLFGLGLALARVEAQPLPVLLAEAQELVAQGRTMEALERLEVAKASATALSGENLVLQEEILWQSAMAHLEFANELTNREQYIVYAGRAREGWNDYIKWYAALTDQERDGIPANNRRISKAVAHLGNSCLRMHEPWTLFSDLANIPEVPFLGTDAIALWKSFLYQCPDWRGDAERNAATRRTKICHERCGNEWMLYADTLEEWASGVELRGAVRARCLREVAQIRSEAERCPAL